MALDGLRARVPLECVTGWPGAGSATGPDRAVAGAARRPGDRRPAVGHQSRCTAGLGAHPGRGAVVPQGGRVLQPLLAAGRGLVPRPLRAAGRPAAPAVRGHAGLPVPPAGRRPGRPRSCRTPRIVVLLRDPVEPGLVALPAHGAPGLRDARLRRRPGRRGASVAPPTSRPWRPTPTTTPRPCCATRTRPGAATPTSWPGGVRCTRRTGILLLRSAGPVRRPAGPYPTVLAFLGLDPWTPPAFRNVSTMPGAGPAADRADREPRRPADAWNRPT